MMGLVIGTYYCLYLPVGVDSYLKYNPKIAFYTLYTFRFIFYMNALVRFYNPFIYFYQLIWYCPLHISIACIINYGGSHDILPPYS